MPQLRNSYNIWIFLFTLGIGLNTLSMAITGPRWLRYGLMIIGVLLLLLSIAVAGRLQRAE